MTKRLRYTGSQATSFKAPPIGLVEPGGEFDVRDEDAERFLRRADIEEVGGRRGKAGTPPSAPPSDPPGDSGDQGDPPDA